MIATPGAIFPDDLFIALGFFAFATWYSGVRVDAEFVAFVPLVLAGGALIAFGMNLAVSTLSFWFVKVDALRWLVGQLDQEFTRYPISIYARGVRLTLTFVVPFAFVNYFPAAYFLHKRDALLGLPPEAALLAPAVGVTFALAAYAFWRFGLARYQGTGH